MPPIPRLTKAAKAQLGLVSNTDGVPSPSAAAASNQEDPITIIARTLLETSDEHCRYEALDKVITEHYTEALGFSATTFAAMSRDDAQVESDRLDLLLNCPYIDDIRKLVAVPILSLIIAALASEDSTFFKQLHAALVKLDVVPGKYPASIDVNEALSLYLGHSHDTLLLDTLGTETPSMFRTTTLMILQPSLEKSLTVMNLLPLTNSPQYDRLQKFIHYLHWMSQFAERPSSTWLDLWTAANSLAVSPQNISDIHLLITTQLYWNPHAVSMSSTIGTFYAPYAWPNAWKRLTARKLIRDSCILHDAEPNKHALLAKAFAEINILKPTHQNRTPASDDRLKLIHSPEMSQVSEWTNLSPQSLEEFCIHWCNLYIADVIWLCRDMYQAYTTANGTLQSWSMDDHVPIESVRLTRMLKKRFHEDEALYPTLKLARS